MKQNLFMCCRCGKEQRTAPECQDVPLGWAELKFQRDNVETIDNERQLQRTTLDTHACGDCWREVLDFLEKVVARDESKPRADVDRLFDEGRSSL